MRDDDRAGDPVLEDKLCFAVYSMSLSFDRFYRPLLGRLGLTYPQYLVMQVLWADDKQSVKAIGERLQLDSGTLTPLLKRLESAGYVERKRDPGDERRLVASLTPAGRALRENTVDLPGQVVCSSGRSAEDLKSLAEQLVALRKILDGAGSRGTD